MNIGYYDIEMSGYTLKLLSNPSLIRKVLDSIILSEITPDPEDKIWLFRVTNLISNPNPTYDVEMLIDDSFSYHTQIQHNLSYARSIFGSIIYDEGACVFSYATQSLLRHGTCDSEEMANFFYRIALHKNEARQNNDFSNFIIHPINLLVHLFSEGTHYHPWTKKVEDYSENAPYSDTEKYTNEWLGNKDYSKLSVKSGNFLELQRNISTLISESVLLAVNGTLPSEKDLNFWEILQSYHKLVNEKS